MKVSKLKQRKYYFTTEYIYKVRERWWFIEKKENKRIIALVVEKLRELSLTYYSEFEVWYEEFFSKMFLGKRSQEKIL